MWLSLCSIVLLALCHTSIGCPWTAISGQMKHMTVTPNYVWAVDRHNYVHKCVRPCNGHFVRDGGTRLIQVDADDYELFGVAANHLIYRRNVDGSGGWARVSGHLKQISMSGLGYVWGVNRHNQVFSCKKPCRGAWVYRPSHRLMQVEGGGDRVYGVDTSHRIFTMSVDGMGVWKQLSGSLRYITASGTMVYGINRHNNFYSCVHPCLTSQWKHVKFDGGRMLQCDATFKTLFATSTSQAVYRYEE